MSTERYLSKEKYFQIIDKFYKDYQEKFIGYEDIPTMDCVISELKKDRKFSENFKIEISETKLNLDERIEIASRHPLFNPFDFGIGDESRDFAMQVCDEYEVPNHRFFVKYKGEESCYFE